MFCGFRKSFRQSEMDTVTIGIDWRYRRLISNLYLKQVAIIRVGNGYSKPTYIGKQWVEGDYHSKQKNRPGVAPACLPSVSIVWVKNICFYCERQKHLLGHLFSQASVMSHTICRSKTSAGWRQPVCHLFLLCGSKTSVSIVSVKNICWASVFVGICYESYHLSWNRLLVT